MPYALPLVLLLLAVISMRLYAILPRVNRAKRAARSRSDACTLAVFLGSGEQQRPHVERRQKLTYGLQVGTLAKPLSFSPPSTSTAIAPGNTLLVKATFSVLKKRSPSNPTRLQALHRTMQAFHLAICPYIPNSFDNLCPCSLGLRHPTLL